MKAASAYKTNLFGMQMEYASSYPRNNDKFNRGAKEEYIKMKSTGGLMNIDAKLAVDNYRILPEENVNWGEGIEFDIMNSSALVYWNMSCYPLYDFVYDTDKKEEVKKAIIQYIADSNRPK